MDLLLLADEQESMIDKYLERGDLYALYDPDLRAICVITDEGGGKCEIKNIATEPAYQRKGYARRLIEFLCEQYKGSFDTMLVGTGDCPSIISFYNKCGFEETYRVKNFFTDNYDHLIFEGDIQLIDMVYLKKDLSDK
jgi:ribosomal protein S18 acetylase RimI-like enzyme